MKRTITKLNAKLKSKTVRRGLIEFSVELTLVDDNTAFMTLLDSIEGVHDWSLVNYTGDYAQ